MGLRSLGPVWSRPTIFGEGVPFAFYSTADTGGGLTEAGQRLARIAGTPVLRAAAAAGGGPVQGRGHAGGGAPRRAGQAPPAGGGAGRVAVTGAQR